MVVRPYSITHHALPFWCMTRCLTTQSTRTILLVLVVLRKVLGVKCKFIGKYKRVYHKRCAPRFATSMHNHCVYSMFFLRLWRRLQFASLFCDNPPQSPPPPPPSHPPLPLRPLGSSLRQLYYFAFQSRRYAPLF